MADEDLRKLAEDLRRTSDEGLANFRENHHASTKEGILADKEFERRARLHQHELDRKLLAEQVRWMKFSLLVGVASALAGVILGWLLQRNWPPGQSQNITPKVQSETSPSKAVDHKEKTVSVP